MNTPPATELEARQAAAVPAAGPVSHQLMRRARLLKSVLGVRLARLAYIRLCRVVSKTRWQTHRLRGGREGDSILPPIPESSAPPHGEVLSRFPCKRSQSVCSRLRDAAAEDAHFPYETMTPTQ